MSTYAPLLVVVAVALLVVLVLLNGRSVERKIEDAHASQDERTQEILRTGAPVRARIISISDTGVRMRPHHVYAQLHLRVQPAQGDTYEMDTFISVPALKVPWLVPGRDISARIDAQTREVAIAYDKQ
ncbi:hypothetical protein D9M72_392700 [compost metagenome]